MVALSPDWRSYVELPRTYSFYTKGFCGNYDDELDSDSLTSERMQANEESLGKEIGDSYVVKKDTPLVAAWCEVDARYRSIFEKNLEH